MSELYDLMPTPSTPDLPGTVVMREDADSVVDAIAGDLVAHATNCIREFGDFHLALSGGSTPLPLYRRLMYDPNYRDLPWARTHLWIVDERRVPFDDDKSNFKAISELIVDHSGIPQAQVHPIFAMSETADTEYESLLRETLGWRPKGHDRLDFVLLGMGGDGHTASLFPHSPALVESIHANGSAEHLVRINAGPTVTPPDRVTMTLPLLNASRFLALMVVGESKREALSRVAKAHAHGKTGLDEASSPDTAASLPVLGLSPLGGVLRWYLDHAACPAK